jgi:hypothetical protein
MVNYQTNVLKTKTYVDSKQTTFQMVRSDKTPKISVKDIRKIVSDLETKANKQNNNIKIAIRGLNPEKYHTLKGFSTDLRIVDFEDYLRGKVKDTSKFEFFSQVEVTILKEI